MVTFAQDLWQFFSHLLGSMTSAIGGFFQGTVNALGNVVLGASKWLAGVLSDLFQGFANLFAPVLAGISYLIQGIGSFFTHLFTLIQLVFELLIQVFHVLFAFAGGFFSTIAGINYNDSTPTLPSDVTSAFANMQSIFSLLQLDTLAYVLHFAIWFFTAYAIIKMLGNFGVGSE